jgi:GT2 family glycosyltransferase
MVVRRETFLRVGGFDETLEACEDVDLSRRLRQTGGVLRRWLSLRSTHHGDPTSLAALFRSELWRGRNNLRVSLRERLTFRSMLSIAVPVCTLFLLGASVILLTLGQIRFGAAALVSTAVPSVARATHLSRRAGVAWRQAVAVALTYDLARAVALVMRQPHRRIRPDAIIAAR